MYDRFKFRSLSWSFLLIQLGFIVLYALAYYFRYERAQLEAARELFHVINHESFWILDNGRFIVGLSQVLPLIAVKLQLHLDVVVASYSINHVLFFHVISSICWLFDKKNSAFTSLLIPVLGSDASFFSWPFGEVLYGCGLLLLWNLVNDRIDNRFSGIIVKLILCFLLLTSHPLVFLLFVGLLHWRRQHSFGYNLSLKQIAVMCFLYVLISWFFNTRIFFTLNNPATYFQLENLGEELSLTLSGLFQEAWPHLIIVLIASILLFRYNYRTMIAFTGFTVLLYLTIFLAVAGLARASFYSVTISFAGVFAVCHAKYSRPSWFLTRLTGALTFITLVLLTLTRSHDSSIRYESLKELTQRVAVVGRDAIAIKKNTAEKLGLPVFNLYIQAEALLISCATGDCVSMVYAPAFRNDFRIHGENPNLVSNISEALISGCKTNQTINYECHRRLNDTYFDLEANRYTELRFNKSGELTTKSK